MASEPPVDSGWRWQLVRPLDIDAVVPAGYHAFMHRLVPDSGAIADMIAQGKSRRGEWVGLGSSKQSLHFDLSQDDD